MRILALVLLASCAAPRGPVEVWIPHDTSEETQREIAAALEGHPPPRSERLPAHRVDRRVRFVANDPLSWPDLIAMAEGHARAAHADAVVILQEQPRDDYWRYPSPWSVEMVVVRYVR